MRSHRDTNRGNQSPLSGIDDIHPASTPSVGISNQGKKASNPGSFSSGSRFVGRIEEKFVTLSI
jgi:hypothetical protein